MTCYVCCMPRTAEVCVGGYANNFRAQAMLLHVKLKLKACCTLTHPALCAAACMTWRAVMLPRVCDPECCTAATCVWPGVLRCCHACMALECRDAAPCVRSWLPQRCTMCMLLVAIMLLMFCHARFGSSQACGPLLPTPQPGRVRKPIMCATLNCILAVGVAQERCMH
jgi:hypothetical protein